MTGNNSSGCKWNGVLKITVQDPDAMLAWIIDNIPAGVVHGITSVQIDRDAAYEMKIDLTGETYAALIKTFWDSAK